jgi:CRISPR/Cas system CSM-associated protein Csm3 (group 7 of RAMP superfamily)
MSRYVHRMRTTIVFPAGVAPGEGKLGSNRAVLARDGVGRPVLRGTALAGAVRAAWEAHGGVNTERWFGRANETDDDAFVPSQVRFRDVVLGNEAAGGELRMHNAVDRHTGAVRDGAVFSVEALPPGTGGEVIVLVDDSDEDPAQGRAVLSRIALILNGGVTLGGQRARGIGRVVLRGGAQYCRHDLATLDGASSWMDESRALRDGAAEHPAISGEALEVAQTGPEALRVTFTLAIPRGQDLCVGDGAAHDFTAAPQRVRGRDGEMYWRLPGSTLRGIFRAWVTRLAARAGKPVADSHARHATNGAATGEELGWGFDDKKRREEIIDQLSDDPARLEPLVPCPVMRLFGSLYARGRVHVSDGLSPCAEPAQWEDAQRHQRGRGTDWQRRKHVAVDRFTGGATDGALFEHVALTGAHFKVTLTVERPSEEEAVWLAASLRAIDMGLLRVGTSKSSGRLALASAPEAEGPLAERFTAIKAQGAGR